MLDGRHPLHRLRIGFQILLISGDNIASHPRFGFGDGGKNLVQMKQHLMSVVHPSGVYAKAPDSPVRDDTYQYEAKCAKSKRQPNFPLQRHPVA